MFYKGVTSAEPPLRRGEDWKETVRECRGGGREGDGRGGYDSGGDGREEDGREGAVENRRGKVGKGPLKAGEVALREGTVGSGR